MMPHGGKELLEVTTEAPSSAFFFESEAEEESNATDAVRLAVYMLVTFLFLFGSCLLGSYCKKKYFPSAHETYSPVYTESMDETTHGTTEMVARV